MKTETEQKAIQINTLATKKNLLEHETSMKQFLKDTETRLKIHTWKVSATIVFILGALLITQQYIK